MAVTLNAKGTSENIFTLGKNGPKLKNNAGVIELRNSDDTAFANIQTAGIDDNASETVITIDIDETVQMYRNQAGISELLTLIQDHAGSTGDVLAIGNDGTGDAIEINNTNEARAIFISSGSSTTNAIEVLNQFAVGSIASPANYVKITAATTTNPPLIEVLGIDANIDMRLSPKGAGNIILGNSDTPNTTISMVAESLATDVNLRLSPKGAGNIILGNSDTPNTTISMVAESLATDVNLRLSPKGAGIVNIDGAANLPAYTVAALPTGQAGDTVYCSDGNAGVPCLAVHDGTAWKVVAFGATVSAV